MRIQDDFDDSDDMDGTTEACSECKGTGVGECPMEYGDMRHPDNCPACGGEQKTICTYCDGTGKVTT